MGIKNKRLLLTSHRLREVHKTIFGSRIKSMMLEELTFCELHTSRQIHFLKKGHFYFLSINLAVFMLNHYLFSAKIIQLFFGEVQIDSGSAELIFYFSVAVLLSYIGLFVFSVKKVFSFYANGLSIDFQLRWLDFEERESFISMIEDAKDQRCHYLYGLSNKMD